jgi:hypothetical protein
MTCLALAVACFLRFFLDFFLGLVVVAVAPPLDLLVEEVAPPRKGEDKLVVGRLAPETTPQSSDTKNKIAHDKVFMVVCCVLMKKIGIDRETVTL